MKYCPRCKAIKEESEFHRAASAKDGRQSICKLCRKAWDAQVYIDGGEEYKRRKQRRQQEATERNTRFVFAYLQEHPCVDCGEGDPLVLEFDHVRGEKRYNISDILQKNTRWETIKAEIEKCEVRCANCHRRVTARRKGVQRYLLWLEAFQRL